MHLLSAELNGSVALRHALQAAIVATAAVAGYVTVLPLASQFHQADEIAVEQPVWAGHIERPDLDAPQPAAPVTSASYLVQEPASGSTMLKKNASTPAAGLQAAAVMPKAASKPILPPRRPVASEDIVKVSAPGNVTASNGVNGNAAGLVPPADIPEAAPKPASRNLMSRVTDHLPSTGSLLAPFHVVGDSFHNLIKWF
jgi:hypothetical protein